MTVASAKKRERSEEEILHDMLAVTLEEKPVRKTRIMQRAYLNPITFHNYFEFLLKEGFLRNSEPEKGCYEITEKGMNLLTRLREVKKTLQDLKNQNLSVIIFSIYMDFHQRILEGNIASWLVGAESVL